ncbi:uncharacterized protein LOC112055581 [Bicyclus anynana]|uniref:Uncharacterized protein LOC112055581 n=1 Tax=Bicyclus anynana TaxID=110368 RepID=A0A6J1NUZ6_BICAN|nr:uncharacterized protein LOC112055581 [Bicyclus anynana]
MPFRKCNLECEKDKKGEVLEFVGPVKITLVDRSNSMEKCFQVLQACLISGIISLNPRSGAAAPMRVADRKVEHILVEIFAIIFTLCSCVFAYYAYDGYDKFTTLHSTTGFLANGVILLSALPGIFIFPFFRKTTSMQKARFGPSVCIHVALGVLATIISSVCFVIGISKPTFRKWLPEAEILTFMIYGCSFYSAMALYKPAIMLFTSKRDNFLE